MVSDHVAPSGAFWPIIVLIGIMLFYQSAPIDGTVLLRRWLVIINDWGPLCQNLIANFDVRILNFYYLHSNL